VEVHKGQGADAGRGRRPCPLHGPHLVDVVESGSYVAQCLVCGMVGLLRKDVLEAKLAFDETWR
jgi:hypothetical protein